MQAKQSNKPCMSSKTKSRTDLHHNQEPLMINVVTTRIPASSRTLNYIPIWKSYCITRLIYIYIEWRSTYCFFEDILVLSWTDWYYKRYLEINIFFYPIYMHAHAWYFSHLKFKYRCWSSICVYCINDDIF